MSKLENLADQKYFLARGLTLPLHSSFSGILRSGNPFHSVHKVLSCDTSFD